MITSICGSWGRNDPPAHGVSGKHKHWHRDWSRTERGQLRHTSGLLVIVTQDADGTDLDADAASLHACRDAEAARGVQMDQMPDRVRRLLREAAEWHQRNP